MKLCGVVTSKYKKKKKTGSETTSGETTKQPINGDHNKTRNHLNGGNKNKKEHNKN